MARDKKRSRQSACWVLAGSIATTGCANSGQTGSPADTEGSPRGEVHVYETPVPIASVDEGGTGSDNVGTGCWPENNPSAEHVPGNFAEVVGGYLVVFATPFEQPRLPPWPQRLVSRGLLIYDIQTPTEPRLVGELPLEGMPLQLEADEQAITVVLASAIEIDEPQVPDEPMPTTAIRLLRIDTSDPTAPSVVAETRLDGEFWRFARTSEGVVVMTSTVVPTASQQECTSPDGTDASGLVALDDIAAIPVDCGAESGHVTSYSVGADGFERAQSVTVEGGALQAFIGEGFYAAVSGARSSAPVLHVVRIGSDGALSELGPVESSGSVTAVTLQGSLLLAAVTAGDGSATLEVVDATNADRPELLGTTPLPTPAHGLVFLPNGSGVWASGNTSDVRYGASLIDIEDPTGPSAMALAGVVEGGWVDETLVGFAPNESGKLSVTLWDVSSPRSPSRIADQDTNWAYLNNDAVIRPWTLDAELGCLIYPSYSYGDNEYGAQVGVACIEGDAIVSLGQVDTLGGLAATPVVAHASIYGVTERSLFSVSVDREATRLDVGAPVEIFSDTARSVLEERPVGDYRVALIWEDSELAVELTPREGSGSPLRVPLEHFAEGLVVAGKRVVAMGLRRNSDCDLVSEYPEIAADARCPTPNQSGITVIGTTEGPSVEATFAIDNTLDVPKLPEDARATSNWYGYVRLSDERLFLPVERYIRCESQAACDELGLEAEQGMTSPGSSGCGPDEECSSEPAEPITTYSGVERQIWGYVLDLNAASGPRLLPGTRLAADSLASEADRWSLSAEGPLDLGRQALVSGDTVGFVSEQWLRDESGELRVDESGRQLARYWLRRVTVDREDQVEWLDRINTPGAAIAMTNNGETAFSVAPEAEDVSGAARRVLHRLSLDGGGATIDETLSLGAGFRAGLSIGERAYFLLGPEDRCAPDPSTQYVSVALDEQPLEKTVAFELPFDNWQFAIWEQQWKSGSVLLRGGPQSYQGLLQVDISGAKPEVLRYYTRD